MVAKYKFMKQAYQPPVKQYSLQQKIVFIKKGIEACKLHGNRCLAVCIIPAPPRCKTAILRIKMKLLWEIHHRKNRRLQQPAYGNTMSRQTKTTLFTFPVAFFHPFKAHFSAPRPLDLLFQSAFSQYLYTENQWIWKNGIYNPPYSALMEFPFRRHGSVF